MPPTENLSTHPSFKLPQLPAELEDLARGVEQQAQAARGGTAMGQHADPEFFLRRVAFALKAAALQIRADHPEANPVAPEWAPTPVTDRLPGPPPEPAVAPAAATAPVAPEPPQAAPQAPPKGTPAKK